MWYAALALLVLTAEPMPADGFRWLDPGADAPLLRQVEQAFRRELKPDDPAAAEARHQAAVLLRYVDRLGVVGEHALVLIGNRVWRDEPEGTWFDAWNHDLGTGRKERIRTSDALFMWRFRGLASFEPSPVPGVVFQYFNCWECESTLSLASFRFEPGSGRWSARCWLHFDEEVDFVEIEKSTQYYEDEDVEYEFRHAIRDVTGDGFADVVVGRNDTGLTTRKTSRRLLVHTWVDGRPVTRPPTDAETDAVQAALFPHGPPPHVAKPREGRFSNPRFGYAVAFPAELAAIPASRTGAGRTGSSSRSPEERTRTGRSIAAGASASGAARTPGSCRTRRSLPVQSLRRKEGRDAARRSGRSSRGFQAGGSSPGRPRRGWSASRTPCASSAGSSRTSPARAATPAGSTTSATSSPSSPRRGPTTPTGRSSNRSSPPSG